jgi:hypothetical protein
MRATLDTEQWMRVFAFQRVIGNTDCYGRQHGHNMYTYHQAQADQWKLLLYDIELNMGTHSSDSTNSPLLTGIEDPTMSRFIQMPEFQRAFWRSLQEAANGPMLLSNCGPVAHATYSLLYDNGQKRANTYSVLGQVSSQINLTNWLSGRRAYLTGELARVSSPFTITNGTSSGQSNIVLGGFAQVEVAFLRFAGTTTNALVSWPTLTNWNISVMLVPGNNTNTVLGYDRHTNYLTGFSNQVVISYP